MIKPCHKCGCLIELTARQVRYGDYQCQTCRRTYNREWMAQWRAKRRLAGLPTYNKKWQTEYNAEHNQRPEMKQLKARLMAIYRRDPRLRPRHLARLQAYNAVASGVLKKLPCRVCGAENSQMHHPDYEQPLLVVWLCRKCHAEEHAKLKWHSALVFAHVGALNLDIVELPQLPEALPPAGAGNVPTAQPAPAPNIQETRP